MTISEFTERYGGNTRPINEVLSYWVADKRADDFLSTTIAPGVVLGDALIGGELSDTIPKEEVREAFGDFDGYSSLYEIKQRIRAKIAEGDPHIDGLLHKIQGQMGENAFLQNVGGKAGLASSGSQKGWDVWIQEDPENIRYVQVKAYTDPQAAIKKLEELNQDLNNGQITGMNGEPITHIDFAVNSEIYEEVATTASERGIAPGHILDGHYSVEDIKGSLEGTKGNIENPFFNLFEELFGGLVIGTSLQIAANAFLLWKREKELAQFVEDSLYGSMVTGGGITAAYTTETLIGESILLADLEVAAAILTSPIGALAFTGVALYTRAILQKLADRRHVVRRLEDGNVSLAELARTVAVA